MTRCFFFSFESFLSYQCVLIFFILECEACRSKQGECPVHKIPSSNRKLVIPGQKQPVKFSYAIASFPEEVQLCVSSIPGAGCGVCAKQHIPVGTWIGPYEGKHVKCDDVKPNTDTSYMWEVLYCFNLLQRCAGMNDKSEPELTPNLQNTKLSIYYHFSACTLLLTQNSVWPPLKASRISSKILRYVSYFQLSSRVWKRR